MTQELRKLAEAARTDAGEWKWDGRKVDSDGYVYIPECSYLVGNICLSDQYEGYQAHCDFIAAANPTAILSLLDRLEKAEKDAARWKFVQDNIYSLPYDDHGVGPEFDFSNETIDAAMEAK